MPAPPDASWFDALTPSQQVLLNIAFFLITAAGMAFGYFRKPPEPPASPKDMMLTAAGITDMKPIRDLVEITKETARQQERAADALEKIGETMKDWVTSEELDRLVEQKLREKLEPRR